MKPIGSGIYLGACGKHHWQEGGEAIGHECGGGPSQAIVRMNNPVDIVRANALRDSHYHASPARMHNPVDDETDEDEDVMAARRSMQSALDFDRMSNPIRRNNPERDSWGDLLARAQEREGMRKPNPARRESWGELLAQANRSERRRNNPARDWRSVRDDLETVAKGLHADFSDEPEGERLLDYAWRLRGERDAQGVAQVAREMQRTVERLLGAENASSRHVANLAAAAAREARSEPRMSEAEQRTARSRMSNPLPPEQNKEWRRRQIILPTEIYVALQEWHGGQNSATYALMSTGGSDLVSLSMLDAAAAELRRSKGPRGSGARTLADEIETVRQYWREYSAQEAGMLADRDPETFFDYDRADYGGGDESGLERGPAPSDEGEGSFRRNNPVSGQNMEWRKRQIFLPDDIVRELYTWGGGHSSAVYALAEAGHNDLVSLSQIDAAIDELRRQYRGRTAPAVLRRLYVDLQTVRRHWHAYSERVRFKLESEGRYDYDRANYDVDDENEIAMGSL